MVSQAKKIVFYRIGAIGDIIHTLPLLELARELNPQARIEYIVGSAQVADLLEGYAPYINKVHVIKHGGVFDKPSKLFKAKEEQELINYLTQDSVDEFVYLHSNTLKAKLINKRFIKAKRIFIYKKDESLSAVANYVITRYPDLKEDLVENPYRVLKSNSLRAKSSKEITSSPRNDDSRSISIVLGVGKLRPSRAYPLLSWIRFIEYILAETDYQINILGGPDELDLSQEFTRSLELRKERLHYGWLKRAPDFSRINNLIAKTSLVELASVLKNTDRLFSADTGILHIGAALDCEITSIFSITSEKRFGPFSKKAKVLRSDRCSCSLSFTNLPKHCKSPCGSYAKCMFDIDYLDLCSVTIIK